jgi:hypothetical protein
MKNLDEFTKAYLVCAIWSSSDDDDLPFDHNYSIEDISKKSLRKAIEDCKKFQQENSELLQGIPMESAGHDFWLTRNHHGAGFWDRGYGKTGDKLTKSAESFGDCWIYVGDDGKLYLS